MGYKISIFTPTYNRSNTLERVYKSLVDQAYKNFEWIIVDDGSTDNTDDVIKGFLQDASFPIKHHRFAKNKGKHIAYNKALEVASGDLFTVVDSDDEIDPDALEYINNKWNGLNADLRQKLSGIYALCRLYDGSTYSSTIEQKELVTDDIEMVYKLKLTGDRWWVRRLDVVKQFPFPTDFVGPYYTEGIIWKKIGQQYKILLVNKILYTVHYDGAHSLMREQRPLEMRAQYVCLNASDHLNNYFKYILFYPKLFIGQTLHFLLYSFYTRNIVSTWRVLKPSKLLWVLLFAPAGILAHIVFIIKQYSRK